MPDCKVTPGFQDEELGKKFSSYIDIKMVTSIILHASNNSNMSQISAISKETLTKGTETEVAFKPVDVASLYAIWKEILFFKLQIYHPSNPQ